MTLSKRFHHHQLRASKMLSPHWRSCMQHGRRHQTSCVTHCSFQPSRQECRSLTNITNAPLSPMPIFWLWVRSSFLLVCIAYWSQYSPQPKEEDGTLCETLAKGAHQRGQRCCPKLHKLITVQFIFTSLIGLHFSLTSLSSDTIRGMRWYSLQLPASAR